MFLICVTRSRARKNVKHFVTVRNFDDFFFSEYEYISLNNHIRGMQDEITNDDDCGVRTEKARTRNDDEHRDDLHNFLLLRSN